MSAKPRYIVTILAAKATIIKDTKRHVIVCECYGLTIEEAEQTATKICALLNSRNRTP